MRTLNFASLVIVCSGALVLSFSAHSQQSQGQNAPPPPKLEKLEEGEAPAVTVREQKNRQTITEKRAPDGQVKEVKVTKGKNTYYVKPNARPVDGPSGQSRPAQWKVYEFNNKKKPKESDLADVPPPPAPAAAPSAPAKK